MDDERKLSVFAWIGVFWLLHVLFLFLFYCFWGLRAHWVYFPPVLL